MANHCEDSNWLREQCAKMVASAFRIWVDQLDYKVTFSYILEFVEDVPVPTGPSDIQPPTTFTRYMLRFKNAFKAGTNQAVLVRGSDSVCLIIPGIEDRRFYLSRADILRCSYEVFKALPMIAGPVPVPSQYRVPLLIEWPEKRLIEFTTPQIAKKIELFLSTLLLNGLCPPFAMGEDIVPQTITIADPQFIQSLGGATTTGTVDEYVEPIPEGYFDEHPAVDVWRCVSPIADDTATRGGVTEAFPEVGPVPEGPYDNDGMFIGSYVPVGRELSRDYPAPKELTGIDLLTRVEHQMWRQGMMVRPFRRIIPAAGQVSGVVLYDAGESSGGPEQGN